MKYLSTVLGALLIHMFTVQPVFAGHTKLQLSLSGVDSLTNGYHFEGWAIIDGAPISTGKFNVDASGGLVDLAGTAIPNGVFETGVDLTGATTIILTIEPTGDTDAVPAATHYLAGGVAYGSAALTVGDASALADDFASSTGSYILATPTDLITTNENSGIWFLDNSTGTAAQGLQLPTLPAGWVYEGWAVIDGTPVTTGRFIDPAAADSSAPYSGTIAGPPFPGEDFLLNAPGGLTFPTDLAGMTAVISIEPSPDDAAGPFTLKPLTGAIPIAATDNVTYALDNQASGFPTGTATIPTSYELTLDLTGFSPHVGGLFEMRVVNWSDGNEVGRTRVESVPQADFSVSLPGLGIGGSYDVDFYADLNGNGLYDSPGTDHAWRMTVENVLGDTTLTFAHSVTNFVDIGWNYLLTLDLIGFSPHVGQLFELRLVDQADGSEVGRTRVESVPQADFSVSSPGLALGGSYNIDFYADFNQNGIYDAPPTDHAWRLILANVLGDTTLSMSHNVDFTDIEAAFNPSPVLLSEIVVTPTGGEFIEIYNPNQSAVDLSNFYLTDATHASSGTYYYNIVTDAGYGGGDFGDFHARFPYGATIAYGEHQTIALNGDADFFSEYGVNPTYEIDQVEHASGTPDLIPDMREAVLYSIFGSDSSHSPGLTNGDEVVILYYWDGISDLVQDSDYLLYNDDGTVPNEAVDKTGIKLDGPDAGSDSSTYLDDTPIVDQHVGLSPAFGFSLNRLDYDEGVEGGGGNGIDGSDETSEDTDVTFATGMPTPNEPAQPPSPILLSEIVVTPTGGEFIEIYNPYVGDINLSNFYLTDATHASSGTYYYNIVTDTGYGGGAFGDFHARFPNGAIIAPAEHQTIALNGDADFFSEYGVNPTYEIDQVEHASGTPDLIPDMREAVLYSIFGSDSTHSPGLTNGDEVVILYYWDGISDLVQDSDYLLYNDDGTVPNEAVDKTGIKLDGPDAGSDSSTYLDDTPIVDQHVGLSPGSGFSLHRIDYDEGAEVAVGGNGIDGSDESSEDTDVTFATGTPTPNETAPDAPVGVSSRDNGLPEAFSLGQNFPNPFNPVTTLRFDLPVATDVTIVVYDLIGHEVIRLINSRLEPGYHQVRWHGRDASGADVSTGLYIGRIVTPEYTKSVKMVLLK